MRRDIQLLRGISVLLVVIYHSGIGPLRFGYLGVDVFFVISGFLITSNILKGLEGDDFSFAEFYLRRARRLLPALFTTLLGTVVIGHFLLTPSEYKELLEQAAGAVGFAANFVLPTQFGYFQKSAESAPLLHIWSLSLEEQYYFFLPLFLFLLSQKLRLFGLLCLFALSLFLCVSWTSYPQSLAPLLWRIADISTSEWAFYLFPTRAWELLAGSICAWVMLRWPGMQVQSVLKCAAIAGILLVSSIGWDPVHPRGDSMLVVLAAVIIVLGNDRWVPNFRSIRVVERMGDWSYSIYLVHWPLFAYAYIAYVGIIPLKMSIFLACLSILFGFLQYRYVEVPYRYVRQEGQRRIQAKYVAMPLLGLSIVWLLFISAENRVQSSEINFEFIQRPNVGLGDRCSNSFQGSELKSVCLRGTDPGLAVWGDSYAMHLVPGIASTIDSLVQLTMAGCGPTVGVVSVGKRHDEHWIAQCLDHNARALETILSNKSITTVVLSSNVDLYFQRSSLYHGGESFLPQKEQVLKAFTKSVKILQDAGKAVIFVSPPPQSGYDLGACLERRYLGVPTLLNDCDFDQSIYHRVKKESRNLIKELSAETGVEILWLEKIMCAEGVCSVEKGDVFLYRDEGHLTVSGSIALLKNINWEVNDVL